MMGLSVDVAGIRFRTPLIAASGTFGYGTEYLDVADYDAIGGIAVKGLYLAPREGAPPPRIWETPSGMLNAIGLQEVGIERFIEEKMPRLRELGVAILVNICGSTLEEYAERAFQARAMPSLVVTGGVAANAAIAEALARTAGDAGARLIVPPMALCGDNAAMIAWAGAERLAAGKIDDATFEARPRWPLDGPEMRIAR